MMIERREMASSGGKELASAITLRLGIGGGGVLGGIAGYGIGTLLTQTAPLHPWIVAAGAFAGFVTTWGVLTWLARKHRGAGIIAGVVLTLATTLTLIVWFVR